MQQRLGLAMAVRDVVVAVERHRARAARRHPGLGTSAIVALGHLFATGPVTAAELASELSMTSASATELVDRLERSGFANRLPHPTDRRKRLITLTACGEEIITELLHDVGTQIAPGYASLNDDQRRGVDHFLAAASEGLASR